MYYGKKVFKNNSPRSISPGPVLLSQAELAWVKYGGREDIGTQPHLSQQVVSVNKNYGTLIKCISGDAIWLLEISHNSFVPK